MFLISIKFAALASPEARNNFPNMDNNLPGPELMMPVPKPPKNPGGLKLVIWVVLALLVILGAVLFFIYRQKALVIVKNSQQATAKVPVAPAGTADTKYPITNFISYKGNALPPSFPSDFPNPAKPGSMLLDMSDTLSSGQPVSQSIFRFNTGQAFTDIQKIYTDYFTKNNWQMLSLPAATDGFLSLAAKNGSQTVNVNYKSSGAPSASSTVTVILMETPDK